MELEEELSARITDLLNFKLKREQEITVESMFMNEDVLVLLPTFNSLAIQANFSDLDINLMFGVRKPPSLY